MSQALVLEVSGHEIAQEPEATLAARLHQALERSEPAFAQEAAADAVHSTSDPRALAHAANERLDEARRRLDTERQALDDVSTRRARLVDTVLYEAAGSQVDAYARSHRGGIESALRAFGLAGTDPIQSYKNEVSQLAQPRGGTSRAGLTLRSLWAYRGQMRFLVLAVIFFLLAWGVRLSRARSRLVGFHPEGRRHGPAARRLASGAHQLACARCEPRRSPSPCLCILANLWRAFRFLQPVFHGATLLQRDVAQRGQDLDARLSHQTRRVDNLARDVDALAARAAEAEKRAGTDAGGQGAVELPPFHASASDRLATESARAFFESVSQPAGVAPPGTGRNGSWWRSTGSKARASAAIDSIAALVARPGFVAIIAADPSRVGADRLARIVQVPFTLGSAAATEASVVDRLLGRSTMPGTSATEPLEPRHSMLDTPVSDGEAELLSALAPLAGPSPRGIKRFVNLYRLARLDAPDDLAALAFILALDTGGTADEIAAMDASLTGSDERAPLTLSPSAGSRLTAALAAAEQVEGKRMTLAVIRRARQVAATWSFGEARDRAF